MKICMTVPTPTPVSGAFAYDIRQPHGCYCAYDTVANTLEFFWDENSRTPHYLDLINFLKPLCRTEGKKAYSWVTAKGLKGLKFCSGHGVFVDGEHLVYKKGIHALSWEEWEAIVNKLPI